jgi:hypothetical protein
MQSSSLRHALYGGEHGRIRGRCDAVASRSPHQQQQFRIASTRSGNQVYSIPKPQAITLSPPLTVPPFPLRCRGMKLSMRRARVHHHCRRAGQIGVEPLVVLEQSTYESDSTTYNNDAPENRTPNPCAVSYSIPETAGRPLLNVAPPFAL